MTLRDDLTELLADAGLVDVDVDEAIADEHRRTSAYLRVTAVAAASRHRDGDRALVATIVRDPEPMVSKTVVVDLVDRIAASATDAADFQRWADSILPETEPLVPGNRRFIQQRVRDWECDLAVRAGHTPTPEELAAVSDWMQRRLAERSTAVAVLAALAEHGRTRKIRNIAKDRAIPRSAGSPRERGGSG